MPPAPPAFHIMTKPIGPICNLDCSYCFYLEKEQLYDGKHSWRMSDEVLERYIRDYIAAQQVEQISFAWQGGEPTLMGVDFFRRVVELQKQYTPPGKRVENAFQTNATLIDDEWAAFLAEAGFLVGVSIDGPADLHDFYRVDKGGKPTHTDVIRGLRLLQKHGVEFNTLTVVNRRNAKEPKLVYRYLRELGSQFMQFIPLVEREGADDGPLDLAEPPPDSGAEPPVTDWSVTSSDWGDFLCGVFDEWVHHDVGQIYVQLFETQLGILAGMPASLCVFAKTCGTGMALEHNGDLYSCDHYVYPQYKLGNVAETDVRELAASEFQHRFGQDKFDTLPGMCRRCDYLVQCYGECPKHRFAFTPDGEFGLNYLCAGYMRFFQHSRPYFVQMLELHRYGQPAAAIMDLIREQGRARQRSGKKVGRNQPCPCGSGKKYKHCCGRGG